MSYSYDGVVGGTHLGAHACRVLVRHFAETNFSSAHSHTGDRNGKKSLRPRKLSGVAISTLTACAPWDARFRLMVATRDTDPLR